MMTVPFHFMFHIKGSIYQGKTDFFTVTITQLLSFPHTKMRKKYCISLPSSKFLCMPKN